MRLISYEREGVARFGAQVEDLIVDLRQGQAFANAVASSHNMETIPLPPTVPEFLAGGGAFRDQAKRTTEIVMTRLPIEGLESLGDRGIAFSLADVTLKPPVRNPEKIICLGLNYRDHAKEAGRDTPEWPVLFTKTPNTLIGEGEEILLPPLSNEVDFEGELAVVIGKRAHRVPAEDAGSCIGGYAAFNDVSARDFQKRTPQWFSGKAFDTFGPLGSLVTSDDVSDAQDLRITVRLNDQTMQDSSTSLMIFPIPFLIEYITSILTLEPGDIIATGTPAGVGFVRTPPIYLEDGDVVTVDIEVVGSVTNPVKREQ